MVRDASKTNRCGGLRDIVPDPASSAGPITSYDQLFELVVDAARRNVLLTLRDAPDEVVSFRELVDAVYARAGPDLRGPTGEESTASDLHHLQLPHLDDAGILEYDWRSRTVRYHGDEALDVLLESTNGDA